MKTKLKNLLGKLRAVRFQIRVKEGVYIGRGCSLKGRKSISLSENVTIRPNVQIWSGGIIEIDEGSEIGERCRISILNSCKIGNSVLLSPNVYITDCDHEYHDISIPVMEQGVAQHGQKVFIGDGSYIGINCVIVGNVSIGKHCVIGANSVVTRDVPDYSIAVGSPAKIIKQYDHSIKLWKSKKDEQ